PVVEDFDIRPKFLLSLRLRGDSPSTSQVECAVPARLDRIHPSQTGGSAKAASRPSNSRESHRSVRRLPLRTQNRLVRTGKTAESSVKSPICSREAIESGRFGRNCAF